MDKEKEDFIKLLNLPIFTTTDFSELAEQYSLIEREFEKKVYSAPLIGCGAGLILFTSGLTSSKIGIDNYYLIIPSLWAFFFGVVFAVIAGMFYIWNVSKWNNEYINRGNAQNIYKDIHPKMPTSKKVPIGYDSFDAVTKVQIDLAAKALASANKLAKKGQLYLIIARCLIVLSALSFCTGVFVPLYKNLCGFWRLCGDGDYGGNRAKHGRGTTGGVHARRACPRANSLCDIRYWRGCC